LKGLMVRSLILIRLTEGSDFTRKVNCGNMSHANNESLRLELACASIDATRMNGMMCVSSGRGNDKH
jgi:hypothetical protein